MVVEREPPKAAVGSPRKQNQQSFGNFKQPEFGQASPLQNRLDSNVFNIPKPNKARPEHHGAVPGSSHLQQAKDLIDRAVNPFLPKSSAQPKFGPSSSNSVDTVEVPRPANPSSWQRRPVTTSGSEHSNGVDVVEVPRPANPSSWQSRPIITSGPGHSNSVDVVEVPRPANPPNWQSRPPTTSTFSSFQPAVIGFSAVNRPINAGNYVDLTKPQEPFSLDNALLDDRFGAADPYTYLDAGKATENIKALLEGAFEDDEDKPRTRGRKKKLEAVVHGIAEKLENLGVGPGPEKEDHDNGEEDEDDGTVEGLNVKLLPHQVDGVEWMKDKEIGVKKKNGILPKGGILADDVRFLSELGTDGLLNFPIDGARENYPVNLIITCQPSAKVFCRDQ